MDCQEVTLELIAYHLGALTPDVREALDEHLLGCAACLRDYQRVKHAFDESGAAAARPSPEARARLRAAVLAANAAGSRSSPSGVRASPTARELSWLGAVRAALARPIPLYQGLAAACVAAAVALAATGRAPLGRPHAKESPTSVGPDLTRIDTARPAAAGPVVF